ncbi:MAG TPA: hypothetical protein VGV92_02870 [Gammaproteobacteria bacterium]|nr:hypothetical protein [Gammaproteobacteria bacterium]
MKDEKQQLAEAIDEKAKSQGLMGGLSECADRINKSWKWWQEEVSRLEQAKYHRAARLKDVIADLEATANSYNNALSQNDIRHAEDVVDVEARQYEELAEYHRQHHVGLSFVFCYGIRALSKEIDEGIRQQQADRRIVYPILERFRAKKARQFSEIAGRKDSIRRLNANDATLKDDADFRVLYLIAYVIRDNSAISVTDETSFKAALWLCEQPEIKHIEIYNLSSIDYFKQLMDTNAPFNFSDLNIPPSEYSDVIQILTHYSNRMTVDNTKEFKAQLDRFKNVCFRLKLSDENITPLFQNVVNRVLVMKDTPEEILREITRLASRYAPNFFDDLLTKFLAVLTPQNMSAAIDILKHSKNPGHASQLASRYIEQYSQLKWDNTQKDKVENDIIQCLLRKPTNHTQDLIAHLISMRAERISSNKQPLLLLMKNLRAETTIGGMINTLNDFIENTMSRVRLSSNYVDKETRHQLRQLLSEMSNYSLSLAAIDPTQLSQAAPGASAPPLSNENSAAAQALPSAPPLSNEKSVAVEPATKIPVTLDNIRAAARPTQISPGDPEAQFRLGKIYEEGKEGLSKNNELAAKWYWLAAQQGHEAAKEALKKVIGYAPDSFFTELQKEKTDPKIREYWANFLYEQFIQNPSMATLPFLIHAAEAENADAQYVLGNAYAFGDGGIKKDKKEAVKWLEKAALQGNPEGQFGLAFMYYNGRGVNKDHKIAIELYKKAAEQGHAKAQNNAGHMYENGEGVERDLKKALEYYRKAAAQKNAQAQKSLDLLLARHPELKDTAPSKSPPVEKKGGAKASESAEGTRIYAGSRPSAPLREALPEPHEQYVKGPLKAAIEAATRHAEAENEFIKEPPVDQNAAQLAAVNPAPSAPPLSADRPVPNAPPLSAEKEVEKPISSEVKEMTSGRGLFKKPDEEVPVEQQIEAAPDVVAQLDALNVPEKKKEEKPARQQEEQPDENGMAVKKRGGKK